MGVKDLLSFIKGSLRPASLEEFRGECVAVDVSCWLHRGLFSCVEEVAQGQPTKAYLGFPLRMLKLLASFDLHVILVFDGQRLPAKRRTNEARAERRAQAREDGLKALREGRLDVARKALIQTTEVKHEHVRELILAVRGMPGVDVLMAPFEADAQLTFLSVSGIAALIVTEDSDLIPFGARRVLFKMDDRGSGQLFDASQLHRSFVVEREKFDFDKFRRCCILAGCDYLPDGLPGVGLAKARNFFAKISHPDLRRSLRRIPAYLNMPKLTVTNAFLDAFVEAEGTFRHQIIFDPLERRQRPLNEHPDGLSAEDFPFAGSLLSPESRARELALGNLDPRTLERLDSFLPHSEASWSIWSVDYRPGQKFSRRLVAQKPKLLSVGTADCQGGRGGRREDPTALRRIWGLEASLRSSSSEPNLSAALKSRPAKRNLISHYFGNAPAATAAAPAAPSTKVQRREDSVEVVGLDDEEAESGGFFASLANFEAGAAPASPTI